METSEVPATQAGPTGSPDTETPEVHATQAGPTDALDAGATPAAGRATTKRRALASKVAIAQGVFYVATGVWPLVSPGTFQMVTGPKVDMWVVKTLGGMIAVVGGVLCAAGARGEVPREVRALGALSAASLAAADAVYVLKGRISRVYLLDAAVELALIGGWAAAERSRAREA